MSQSVSPLLRNLWYYALPSASLKRGYMTGKILLDEPVLLARRDDGSVFALRDICPHRGIPLSYGQFDGKEVECCYHGWRFDGCGSCTCIPALTGDENIAAENIKVRSYPLRERQGALWIFMADGKVDEANLPPLPVLPDLPQDIEPIVCEVMRFPCHIDHAVIGLMDPAHGPFVHTSWWWRSRKSIHEKQKRFGPSWLGLHNAERHKPSSNSFAYKILGGTPETEIAFQLPAAFASRISAPASTSSGGLTAVTPINDTETEITHAIYTTTGWLKLIAPIIRVFARRFLNQDRDVVVKQQDGLKYEKNLLLIRDSDVQARWYQQVKNEFIRAKEESRDFVNPVKETILKWRS